MLAHGESPARGTGSVLGEERHLKSFWGGAKKVDTKGGKR